MSYKIIVDEEEIDKRIGGLTTQYYERGRKERVWKAVGRNKTLILFDVGNGWYNILRELKNKGVN